MPYLSLAEGRERLLDVCIKLGSARRDLATLRHQLGFRGGRRNMIADFNRSSSLSATTFSSRKLGHYHFITDLDQMIRLLTGMYNDIEIEPDMKGEAKE